MKTVLFRAVVISFLLASLPVAAADSELERATAFLEHHQVKFADLLDEDERRALGRTLGVSPRELTDDTLAAFLQNPVAWTRRGRPLLSTVIKGLPKVADMPGIEGTVIAASHPHESNFRGHGVEVAANSGLHNYQTKEGMASLSRMGAMLRGVDGRERESDGAAFVGGDGIERLVTIKSVTTTKRVTGALNKAARQLFLRNLMKDGSRRSGILVVGFSDIKVFQKLQRVDLKAMADFTGAPILALALDQHTGELLKLGVGRPDGQREPGVKAPNESFLRRAPGSHWRRVNQRHARR